MEDFKNEMEILKSKGLTINNDNIAKNILFSVNYYVLSGYLFSFKNADGSYDNIDFNKLHKIYQCDKRLKSIILYAIEIIEHNLKTKAAYYMATKTSPLSYMHYAYFVNKEEHEKMLRHFNAEFCKSAGLKIFQMEDDQKLQDLILSIHHCYMQTFSTCTCTKIIENNLGKAYILRV